MTFAVDALFAGAGVAAKNGVHASCRASAQLAATPDILQLGMLADTVRRALHGTQVTYLRVALCPYDKPFTDAVPLAAREVRVTGKPGSLDVAVTAIETARAVAGERTVSAFSCAALSLT